MFSGGDMKLSRLIGILLLIESRKQISGKALSDIFEVSIRTIYRDVDSLCEAGIPILTTSGPNGGFSFIEGYRLDAKTLDKHEFEQLLFTLLRQNSQLNGSGKPDNILYKIGQSIPKELQNNVKRLMDSMQNDTKSWWGNGTPGMISVEEKLESIQKSIFNLNKLSVSYKNQQGVGTERIINPYGVIFKGDQWYVVAYCEKREEVRTFLLNRMDILFELNESYEIAAQFDLETYWDRATKSFYQKAGLLNKPLIEKNPSNAPKYPVTLVSHMTLVDIVGGFNLIEENYEGGLHRVVIDLISEKTAVMHLFNRLDTIKIEKPETLKEAIVSHCKKIILRQNH